MWMNEVAILEAPHRECRISPATASISHGRGRRKPSAKVHWKYWWWCIGRFAGWKPAVPERQIRVRQIINCRTLSLIQKRGLRYLSPMHSARWSVFFALLGITALIPAYFVPAMLVANAVDGSQWFSVWTGISTFWSKGHYFLAGLIFCFSMIFPMVKLGLCLLCAAGGKWLPSKVRKTVIHITEWTAKYSMLDVFVIALLVLLVKVDEYVLILPSMGVYLFSFAVFCSVLASGFLNGAIKRGELPAEISRRRGLYLPWAITGIAVTAAGLSMMFANLGGKVDSVVVTNLTKRAVPRTMEKLMGLKEIGKEEHKFWSKDTWKRLVETFQAATTDVGWNDAQASLIITSRTGKAVETERQKISFDDPKLTLHFKLPETLALSEIQTVELKSHAEYAGLVPAESTEELLAAGNDPFRTWTPEWYGRVFKFQWSGPSNPEFTAGIVLTSLGLIAFYWAGSGLLCGGKIGVRGGGAISDRSSSAGIVEGASVPAAS
jgi:paraquat-inducible protein A